MSLLQEFQGKRREAWKSRRPHPACGGRPALGAQRPFVRPGTWARPGCQAESGEKALFTFPWHPEFWGRLGPDPPSTGVGGPERASENPSGALEGAMGNRGRSRAGPAGQRCCRLFWTRVRKEGPESAKKLPQALALGHLPSQQEETWADRVPVPF